TKFSTPIKIILIFIRFISELICCKVKIRSPIHMSRCAFPIIGKGDLSKSFRRSYFFLTNIMSPTTSINTFCTTQHNNIQYCSLHLDAMLPIVFTPVHAHHLCFISRYGSLPKLTSYVTNILCCYTSDSLSLCCFIRYSRCRVGHLRVFIEHSRYSRVSHHL